MAKINSKFVSDVVGLLYSPEMFKVSADEVRDALSFGQLESKIWLAKNLNTLNVRHIEKILIVGGWIGTLSNIIFQMYPFPIHITSSDLNQDCENAARKINEDYSDSFTAMTADMYKMDYSDYANDLVINTSCEHIENVQDWLNLLSPGTLVCLQSNNMFGVDGHVNCCPNLDDFHRKAKLSEVYYADEIIINLWSKPNHKRFMIIGKV